MSREMLENGFSLLPTALGRPYPDYPPLYFWVSTLFSMPFAGVTTLSIVLPSALAAVMTVCLIYMAGCRINSRIGWLAALILATFPEFWMKAGEGTIDMLLAFNVTASLLLFSLWDDKGASTNKTLALAGALCFMILAFYTKGSIGIVLPAAAWGGYLLLSGRFRSFFFFVLLIIPVAAGCLASELFIVWKHGGTALVNDVINMQVTGRIGNKANHPFYYYVLCLLPNAFLWLLAGFLCLRRSDFGEKPTFHHPLLRLSIAWFLTTLTIFTLASTRHGRYLLPLYPPLALLLATAMNHIIKKGKCPAAKTGVNITLFFVGTLLAGGAVYAFYCHDKIYIPTSYLFIWVGAACSLLVYIQKKLTSAARLIALFLLVLATGLSGVNMLVTPESSRRSSGRQFVQAAEANLFPAMKIVVWGINPDGDGVKLAFYSAAKPESLLFVPATDNLKNIPRPFLLIMRHNKGNLLNLQKQFDSSHVTVAANGAIRSHKMIACRIE